MRRDIAAHKVIQHYVKGGTLADTATEFNCAISTIAKILHDAGIASNSPFLNHNLPEDEIVAKYRDGDSLLNIAVNYETTIQLIRNIICKHGVAIKKKGLHNKGMGIDAAEVIRLREMGKTYQQVGDACGVTYERVRQVLIKSRRFDLTGSKFTAALKRVEKSCKICGKPISGPPAKISKRVTCSPQCTGKLRTEYAYPNMVIEGEKIIEFRLKNFTWDSIRVALNNKYHHITQLNRLARLALKENDHPIEHWQTVFPTAWRREKDLPNNEAVTNQER